MNKLQRMKKKTIQVSTANYKKKKPISITAEAPFATPPNLPLSHP